MLHLASASRQEWVREALADVDTLLLDHAHCEKKAASTAMNLIFRYTDRAELMAPLSALAREELRHFERVLAVLKGRGIVFRRLEPSRYAPRLLAFIRKEEPKRLLDTLLCCSLIEARSCERIQLLSEALADEEPGLAQMYGDLFKSEARHHGTYVELATRFFPRAEVLDRLSELAIHEAEVMATPEPEFRFHS